jgi:hypothetical protein
MSSFDIVNYSIRPSKSIQRSLVFEGIQALQAAARIQYSHYVGFGSVWFSDFQIAHKALGIEKMISIEGDEIGYRRAKFNRPFNSVRLERGYSNDVLPALLGNERINKKPWIIWLDYDQGISENKIDDFRTVAEQAPENSIVLITLNASPAILGKKAQNRPERLRRLFGAVVPDDLASDACKDEEASNTVAELVLKFLKSTVRAAARNCDFSPAFQLSYKDGASMLTVGGILSSRADKAAIEKLISSTNWACIEKRKIIAPHLTMKEVAVLQAQLPRRTNLTRSNLQRLGFDLTEEQIAVFERYYRYYPNFAQVTV